MRRIGVVEHDAGDRGLRRVARHLGRGDKGDDLVRVAGEARDDDVVLDALLRPELQERHRAALAVALDGPRGEFVEAALALELSRAPRPGRRAYRRIGR